MPRIQQLSGEQAAITCLFLLERGFFFLPWCKKETALSFAAQSDWASQELGKLVSEYAFFAEENLLGSKLQYKFLSLCEDAISIYNIAHTRAGFLDTFQQGLHDMEVHISKEDATTSCFYLLRFARCLLNNLLQARSSPKAGSPHEW